MRSSNSGRGKRSLLSALVIAFVLVASGSALAVSGASTLVAPDDDSVATGRAAQQLLGDRSGTPRAPNTGQGGLENETESLQPSGGQGSAPDTNTVVPTSGGGSGSGADAGSLPFTGLLAIPILVAGAALLITGVMARRRVSGPSAA